METLYQLISPAILFGVLAYLTNFFGKAMADQKSFSDDRNWDIQLHGISFFLVYIVPSGCAGFVINSFLGTFHAPFFVRVFILLAVVIWVNFVNVEISRKLFKLPPSLKPEQRTALKEKVLETFKTHGYSEEVAIEMRDAFVAVFRKLESMVIGRKVYRFVIATFFMWMLIVQIQMYIANGFSIGELVKLILMTSLVFYGFFSLAFSKSLQMYKKLLVADIYHIDGSLAFQNVSLLKVNDTNIRFLDGNDKLVIMNKDQVLRIEAQRSQNLEA